jgi:hypothetical protein
LVPAEKNPTAEHIHTSVSQNKPIMHVARLHPRLIHVSRRDGTMNTASDDNVDDICPDACHILRLPPELLSKILSYILPTSFLHSRWDDDFLPSLKTLGVIRSTCRTIRSVADNLPFWYDGDFQMELLHPSPSLARREDLVPYVEGMLADSHLKECFSRRKRRWRICSVSDIDHLRAPMYEMLTRTVPGFQENAESLKGFVFPGGPDEVEAVNLDELLNGYPRLRDLEILSRSHHIYTENPPASLRRLAISNELRYSSHEQCICTLNGIRNLEHLRLDYRPHNSSTVSIPRLDRLLPIMSSTTLRSLALGRRVCAAEIDYSPLDVFANLKELEVDVPSSSLFQYLATSVLQLEVIKFWIETLDVLDTLVSAIESPSLRSVKQCGVWLSIDHEDSIVPVEDHELRPAWRPVVAAIARLPHLQVLDLDAPILLEWSIYFEQCRHLQVLSWAIDGYDIPELRNLEQVRRVFATALGRIRPAPCVVIIDRNHRIDGGIAGSDHPWWKTRPKEWRWGYL